MKTYLLPTDFSSNSKNAIEWILNFLQDEKTNFILLNAYFSPQAGAVSVVSINEILRKQAFEDLNEYKTELESSFKNNNHAFSVDAIYGDVLHAINAKLNEINNKEESIVVVGAKGMGAMEKLFIGSNTSSIIKNTAAPVYVIPENATYSKIKKIGLAVDFQKTKNATTLKVVSAIINTTKAQLSAFHVETDLKVSKNDEQQVVDALKNELTLNELSITKISNLEPLVGVQKYIHSHAIDLLVLINRKKPFFANLFHNSFSKQMSFYTDVPLLILHD